MRPADEIAAEIEGLCAKEGDNLSHDPVGAEAYRLLPEAAAALRARPTRDEMHRKLKGIYNIGFRAGQADERGSLRLETRLESERDVLMAELVNLICGPEGAK